MKQLLRRGADANASIKGETALMHASGFYDAQTEAVNSLLKSGARVNTRDREGKSALMWAAQGNYNSAITRRLIGAGAQLEFRDNDGKTALLLAAAGSNLPYVRVLLAAGADVNARAKNGETALLLVAPSTTEDAPELMRLLLGHGARIDARDAEGETALMKAAATARYFGQRDDGATGIILVKAGADVRARDAKGRDVVMREGDKLALPLLEALLASGRVSPAQRATLERFRPNMTLFYSAYHRDIARARLALRDGANPSGRDKDGQTPLFLALQNTVKLDLAAPLVQLLLQAGADPNAPNVRSGMPTLLMEAGNRAPILGLLLAAGADANATDGDGDTALMIMCYRRRATLPALQALLEGGADPNARDDKGQTALMLAISYSRNRGSWGQRNMPFAQLVKQLDEAGAGINAADDKGQTALMLAAHEQQTEAARTLLQQGADIHARDRAGQTALMWATQITTVGAMSSGGSNQYIWPSQPTLSLLLERGANPNAVDKAGQSALIMLAKLPPQQDFPRFIDKQQIRTKIEDRQNIVASLAQLLIQNGTDVSLATKNGNTALKWAKVRGNQPLIALLENSLSNAKLP